MKRSAKIFFFATIFCLSSISVFAQRVIYLDANYKPTTATNYTYKRVLKYKETVQIFVRDYYGNVTSQSAGVYICTVTDHYRTGEIALVGKVSSLDVGCSEGGGFQGQVVAYYKDGNIKRKESWEYGKLNGVVIDYDEEGNETKREEYVKGNLVDESKFSVSADSPIVGTWKYVKAARTSTYIYSQNGVVESIHEYFLTSPSKTKGNWKYTPKTASSGVLEEYLGDDLVERGNVKFLSRNQIEYTITFSQNSDSIGKQYTWIRQ